MRTAVPVPFGRSVLVAALLGLAPGASSLRGQAAPAVPGPAAARDLADSLHVRIRGAEPAPARGTLQSVLSALVPPGELGGVVVDAETRSPLPFAQVAVERIRVGAVTDSLGRFRLRLPPDSSYTILVRHIGYEQGSHVVRMPADSGRVALIALPATGFSCHAVRTGVPGELQPAVRVHLRMAHIPEGRPLSPIVIRTRTMRNIDSVVVTMDYSRGVTVDLANIGPDMEYTVVIRGADIREWRATATKPCGSRTPVEMEAWLFPR